jgi:hypothetical protein
MKVGFTGTRNGMTQAQRDGVAAALLALNPTEFHHGDCVGADAEVVMLLWQLFPSCRVVSHPPVDDRLRARAASNFIMPPAPYLARNRNIVNATDILIGTPSTPTPQRKGGTWYTIRYAAPKRRVIRIYPNGRREDTTPKPM